MDMSNNSGAVSLGVIITFLSVNGITSHVLMHFFTPFLLDQYYGSGI